MRTQSAIIADMQTAGAIRDQYNSTNNEGATDGYNPHEETLARLSEELAETRKNESPLTRDLAGERAWFNSKGFTGQDLAAANKACLARGYSLADMQAACKAAKAAK